MPERMNELRVERAIRLPDWHYDPAASWDLHWSREQIEQITRFWSSRGMRLEPQSQLVIVGTRGSRWGSLTAFDVAKLPTVLTITRTSPEEILCELLIDTTWQYFTHYDVAYGYVELEAFESFIATSDLRNAQWQLFLKRHLRTCILSVLTLTLYNPPYPGAPALQRDRPTPGLSAPGRRIAPLDGRPDR